MIQGAGLGRYYEEFFSRLWAWQEFLHYYGNATFDDDVTTSATRFLLRLHGTPVASKYRKPLLRALTMIREAQGANGAWPQRYPPTREFTEEGHEDYTKFYTFNDGVISNNIDVLLHAYEQLGRREYLEAARRGMDFYIISQLPTPQAGWAQQYDFDLKPAWARTYEIGTVTSGQTLSNIRDLMRFYLITGDRRYLEPIPKAIDWLDSAHMHRGPDAKFTHTFFYEMGTNRPVYMRRVGQTYKDIHYVKTYEMEGAHPYGIRLTIDVGALRKEFQRHSGLSPEQAREQYRRERRAGSAPAIPRISRSSDYRTEARDADEIQELIDSLNEHGGWVTDVQVLDVEEPFNNPPLEFQGYDTGTFVTRMYRLIHYLESLK
jgi:hypothetical protein